MGIRSKTAKHKQSYITITKVTLEEFQRAYGPALHDYTNNTKPKFRSKHRFEVVGEDGNTYKLKTGSFRYKLFYRDLDNLKCITCGLEGAYFLIQKDKYQVTDTYHANLYAVEDDQEIIMTKDHIKRTSEGGLNVLENMQIMCWYCNCVDKH